MFKKALKRLHIIRQYDEHEGEVTASSSTSHKKNPFQQSPSNTTIPQKSSFLNLPLDIFNLIIQSLSYSDLICLSLTTKLLRHVCPPSVPGDPPEPQCISLAYSRCLFPKPSGLKTYSTGWGTCSYCSQKLCHPSCESALFLDHRTGVFYPAPLYPFHIAVPAPTASFSETSGCQKHFLPGHTPTPWDNSPPENFEKPMYKTIWCEHHRCPVSLMKDNYNEEDVPTGAYRFYGDYYARGNWARARNGTPKRHPEPPFTVPHTKFLAGYRKTPIFTKEVEHHRIQRDPLEQMDNVVKFYKLNLNNGIDSAFDPYRDQDPIDEKFFYDTLCRHCFLPIRRFDPLGNFWTRHTCTCIPPLRFSYGKPKPSYRPTLTKLGCHDCGVVSVKFTIIEAFTPAPAYDSHVQFFLVLASEMEIKTVRIMPGNHTIQRLTLSRPEKAQQALEIVRYEPILPLRPRPKCGFQDLPIPIINRILFYMLYNTRYRKPRYIPEARRLIFEGRPHWNWLNHANMPIGTCSQCRGFRELDQDIRARSTWRCTQDCNYGFHMFMTKGGIGGL
ncbi:hypothetical protein TWF730_010101 [Orbilia blumenaviensis]|uniref:F-box domain-containing protein n=1 Tax=Orbilia blumenaviensis TaxID=1796055 RepID=A0AAV9UX60_9PEZI